MSMSVPTWGNIPAAPGTQSTYTIPPNMATAYTLVQVRQTLTQYPTSQVQYVPPPAQIPQPQPPRKKIEWPESVRNYVQRSFDPSNAIPGVLKSDVESKLKETISISTDNGSLWTIDWNSYPLPQQIISNERASWQNQTPKYVAPWPQPDPSSIHVSKKRKSSETVLDDKANHTVPWRSNNGSAGFEDRISFQATGDSQNDFSNAGKQSKLQKTAAKRQRKFDGGYKSTYRQSPTPEPNSGPIVGTSTVLEKKYFRLTAPPIPSQVRPLPILKQTLELLKKKWRKESNYSYICDQFKSLRQDLTVQHIKDRFTVEVYEIHARIALEKGDLGEYNQCQTQLRALYQQKLGGNPTEFKAYRILYFIHTSNRTALNDILAELTPADKEDSAVKHALDVRSALALGNYHRFFRLYLETPNMGAYLMDMFVVRERLAAISNICKAYKPSVTLRFITEELGFESDADAAQFIYDHKGDDLLEEREGGSIQFLTGKAGQRFDQARQLAFRKVDIKGQI